MAGRGIGVPITFACSKCRRRWPPWDQRHSDLPGFIWSLTGRVRRLYGRQASNRVGRTLHFAVEYECLDCRHVGWTRHRDALRWAENWDDYDEAWFLEQLGKVRPYRKRAKARRQAADT